MSKLINKTRLTKFANDFWAKIKGRYDKAFKEAEISSSTGNEKHITFKRVNEQDPLKVSLEDYARLQDKNDFKKDVSSNIGMTDNTLKYGRLNGNENPNRTSGHRGVTSKSFVDGYIDHIVVLADATQEVDESSRWNVWCVTKGATRDDDRVFKKIDVTATIRTQTINGSEEKVVDLPIKEAFTNETYFLVRCEGKRYKVVNVNAENQTDDVVNISVVLGGQNSQISWGTNVKNNIAVMFLVGRESIKSLSEKLDKVSSDSSTYVKHTDCVTTGGAVGQAGKVVKLGADGKLDDSILPAIALNEFLTATAQAWNEQAVANLTFQNGDVIFHQPSQKRYLCINKNATTFNDRFIELNSKDGTVTSVEGKTGAVTLNIALEDNKFKLKINGTGGTETVKEIEMISDDEIDSIINGLPN